MRFHAARRLVYRDVLQAGVNPKARHLARTYRRETDPVPRTAVKSTRPDLLDIEYETFGSPTDPALLLIAGFVVQLTSWDSGFCELLAAGGRYVIRFDNRDCGLSTKLDGAQANWSAALQANLTGGPMPEVPYTLSDMARDCVGLLDALDIDAAHVAGASMGGMIAQTMAIEHRGASSR